MFCVGRSWPYSSCEQNPVERRPPHHFTNCFEPLKLNCYVACLSSFYYIFFMRTAPLNLRGSTPHVGSLHSCFYCSHPLQSKPNCKSEMNSFMTFTDKICNGLPLSVFPPSVINALKMGIITRPLEQFLNRFWIPILFSNCHSFWMGNCVWGGYCSFVLPFSCLS